MRLCALAFALAALATACVTRDRPYRFASPMLGMAQTPPPTFRAPPAPRPDETPVIANRHAAPIRVTTAPRIREASAASAAAIAELPTAQSDARATLPAPHRTTAPAPIPRSPLDLRALTGIRDKRTSLLVAIEWAYGLGLSLEGFAGTTGEDLLSWAGASHRLADAADEPRPGDLLVFDTAQSDEAADLIAIVIARDDRGVTEMLYLGGGVIRRGFVDASRPKKKRDAELRIVNSFIRHGKRWPAKGSHYLAGELLAHVIHLR
ncbi:MAG: hypothetical protein ACKV2T_14335 [Kofleriaceae bacterium]